MSIDHATASKAPAVRAGSVQAWAVAVRPRSLLVAISPVLVGGTLGFARTGSIDLLVRVPDGSGGQRFVVCDYKTNRLAPTGSDADLLDAYLPDRLWPAMFHHHYPLQALLYTVAVHRFLRWRLRGYEPTQHLGGAAYLFVRGMAGPSTPLAGGQPAGICSWPVPPSLTVALSDLLDGRRP